MPVGSYPGRMHPHRDSQNAKLLAAHEAGQFVRASCRACKVTRFYLPADIENVFGNLNAFELDGRFRCQNAGKRMMFPWPLQISSPAKGRGGSL